MAITEESRHQLYTRLDDVLGPQEANTLMEHLPPVGWADVATKQDLDHLHLRLSGDMAVQFAAAAADRHTLRSEMAAMDVALRTEMAAEFTSVRVDATELRRDMDAGFSAVRHEMATGFSALRYEIENQGNLWRLEFQKGLMRHTFALVGMGTAVLGVLQVVERLL